MMENLRILAENSLFIIDNLETSAFRLACITDNPIIFFDQKGLPYKYCKKRN